MGPVLFTFRSSARFCRDVFTVSTIDDSQDDGDTAREEQSDSGEEEASVVAVVALFAVDALFA